MAFSKTLVADTVVARLIEGQGIYGSCNRSFDGLVQAGASSVDIPQLAIPIVKTAGYALSGSDRKKAKDDTTNVNVALHTYSVPLAEEILARYESNGKLIAGYIDSAVMTLQEHFDKLVLTEAQTTTAKAAFAGASMAWEDITGIKKAFDVAKVPQYGRMLCVDANLIGEFYAVDGVKSAVTFNKGYFENGILGDLLGMKVFSTGLLPTFSASSSITGKYSMVGIYGPGMAAILSKFGDVKEAWDTVNLQTVYDVISHFGVKLLDSNFSVVRYKP